MPQPTHNLPQPHHNHNPLHLPTMPKQAKRAGEKLDKDLYDARAGEDDRFAEVPDPGRGMTKASSDVMQRRRIIKVSR